MRYDLMPFVIQEVRETVMRIPHLFRKELIEGQINSYRDLSQRQLQGLWRIAALNLWLKLFRISY